MTATAANRAGRRLAERLMLDTAVVTRPAGQPVYNPNTMRTEPTEATTLYTGKCRVRQPTSEEHDQFFGQDMVTTSRYMVWLPHDTVGLNVDDVITVTASDDGDLVNRQFRVLSVPTKTFSNRKNIPCRLVEE